MPVLLLVSGGINQARIRRGILWFEFLDRFEIGRVGNDFGKLLKLLELIQLCLFLLRDSSTHNKILRLVYQNVRPQRKIDNDKSVAAACNCGVTSRTTVGSVVLLTAGNG